MITKNQPSAYSDLFRKAEEVLGLAEGTINNIDKYFARLKQLAEKEQEDPSIDPIFTILPTTEETFNIDANSRTISIPANFAKYGVGVQGDEIAEIIYFSIDRYFDAMDLADMDIVVQWKHSSDTTQNFNLSATYKKSLTLQPGKIVFGWPIGSEITEKPGNIQFSVRFYRRDLNNQLIYSFSTATATIKIQSGLNFDLSGNNIFTIDKNQKIYQNLRNSIIADPEYVVAMPEFISYYILSADGTFEDVNDNRTYDLSENLTFITRAEISAQTNDYASELEYKWYRNNEALSPVEVLYRPASKYNKNEIYYHLDENEEEYIRYQIESENEFKNTEGLCIRYSAYKPEIAGIYHAEATNSFEAGNYKTIKSQEWIVPFPVNPEFEYTYNEDNTADEGVKQTRIPENDGSVVIDITVSVSDNGIVESKWYKNEGQLLEDFDGKIAEEGYYYKKATNNKNNATTDEIESERIKVLFSPKTPVLSAISSDGRTSNEGSININLGQEVTISYEDVGYGEMTCQWYQQDGTGFIEINNANKFNYTPINAINHKCIVTHTYERASTSSEFKVFVG